MTLNFPNPSRSYDEKRNAVRFSGYDGMFEIMFYVSATALTKPKSPWRGAVTAEASNLMAFDAARAAVYDAARKVYVGKGQPIYTITADDLS